MKATPGLWAIAAYFNPERYGRRRANFSAFRRNLGVPLLAVELAGDGAFELNSGDADKLVQLRGNPRIWQKERLLNLALDALPAGVRHVAWLDSDLVFARGDWAEQAASQLDGGVALLQPFSEVRHMPRDIAARDATPALLSAVTPLFRERAFTKAHCEGFDPDGHAYMPRHVLEESPERGRMRTTPAVGFAFAAPLALMREAQFYDGCVIGGGDGNLAFASVNRIEDSPHGINSPRQAPHFRAWGERFSGLVQGRVGWVDGAVFHLWHGSYRDRRYLERFDVLRRLDFDPARDIALGPEGAWEWTGRNPELEAEVARHFELRREDGEARTGASFGPSRPEPAERQGGTRTARILGQAAALNRTRA